MLPSDPVWKKNETLFDLALAVSRIKCKAATGESLRLADLSVAP
jgi:hypothetical protein